MCPAAVKGVGVAGSRCELLPHLGTFNSEGRDKVTIGSFEEGPLSGTLQKSGDWVPLQGGLGDIQRAVCAVEVDA